MSSKKTDDWLKIAKILLGPLPEVMFFFTMFSLFPIISYYHIIMILLQNFQFIPKHKSDSYSPEPPK